MKKQNIMPAVVLTSICIIVAVLLAVVNMITKPFIDRAEFAAIEASLKEVMPDAEFDPQPDALADGAPETIRAVYTDKKGGGKVVVLITNKGYTGKEIGITVGIDNDGKIINLKITKNEESIVPDIVKPGGNYGDAYVGVGADEVADLVTGATVYFTESAIKAAVSDAISYATGASAAGNGLPKTDEEILALAKELNTAFGELELFEIDGINEFVKRIYKDKGGKGYFAYIVTSTEWNKHEAELGVAFDKDGKVTATKLLAWNLSPNYEHNDIPGDDFAASLVGKDETTLPNVELITHVTQTSARLRDAVLAVLKAVGLPGSEREILAAADELFGKAGEYTDVTPANAPTGVKRIYKNSDGTYVAYIVTSTEWNPKETEVVLAVDEYGVILGTKLLTWTLSPTYEHNDIPGDAFVSSFVGKDEKSASDVELVTHVTQTTTRVRDAVVSALGCMEFSSDEPGENYAARIVGITVLVLAAAVSVAVVLIIRRKRAI